MVKRQKKLRICKECGIYIIGQIHCGLCHRCYYKNYRKGYVKEYYLKNRRKIINKTAKWRKDNPQKNFLMRQKYREKNKKIIRKKKRAYKQKNWYWIKKHDLHYTNNRKKYDIKYRIQCNLRLRLYHVVKGCHKNESAIKLIGCSMEYLLNYLECQFDDEMSWRNYGKWQIDHIKPCAKFDLTKEEEQEKCFHYSNLQPLWQQYNLMKGAT